ncbi:hypothetical protein BSL78_05733 [Apostichopus japonicus]|uniref:Uncharacterized protein n=1 Tax=Stichopus japonicus TaxID=307972 RepID=A0A2G8LAU2_STIJA|nr:hypothetical protein BSL78_05733 [Apostichopus japonicus]
MDEGTFRNTPTVHPMERRKKLMEADANASIFNLDEQENRDLLLSMSRKRSDGRLPLRNFNRSGKRNLKEAAGRKLRGVKKAWDRLNRWKPSSQQQWAANLATPHTPSTRKNRINSPLTPSTLRNSRCNGKSPRWMIYRDFNNVTPGSIFDSPYSKSCRRSARIAGKQKTPVRMKPGSPRTPVSRVSDAPSCAEIASPEDCEETSSMSIDASAAFQEVINRMEALNQGMATFEKMSSSLTESIKANESHNETTADDECDDDKPTKSLRRQTSSFLRRSLRLQSS